MPLDFYTHPISPPANAVIIASKALKVDLNLKEVDLFGGATRAPEYLKINPSHTVPTLVDGDFTLFESRAIMTYLANKYAPEGCSLYPKDPAARAQVDKVLFYDASGYYPSLKTAFIPIFRQKTDPPQAALDDLQEKIAILESMLGDQLFFTGTTPTLADISLAVSIPILKFMFPQFYSAKLAAWFERVEKAFPALVDFGKSLEKLSGDAKTK